jgi:hypothetical protein
MFSAKEETSVTLGGETFSFSARNAYVRCFFVCGGFTGLHPSHKWSTWSPGRYRIPESDDELWKEFFRATRNYQAFRRGIRDWYRRHTRLKPPAAAN